MWPPTQLFLTQSDPYHSPGWDSNLGLQQPFCVNIVDDLNRSATMPVKSLYYFLTFFKCYDFFRCNLSTKIVDVQFLTFVTSSGGLGVECLLHKKHDSVPVDQSLLGAWYRLYVYRVDGSRSAPMII